jgi:hypothetical protein
VRLFPQKLRPSLQEFAGLVKFDYRMRPVAEDPHVVVPVDIHGGDFAEVSARWKLRPAFHHTVGKRWASLNLGMQASVERDKDQELLKYA